jgi:hypothetical protein
VKVHCACRRCGFFRADQNVTAWKRFEHLTSPIGWSDLLDRGEFGLAQSLKSL